MFAAHELAVLDSLQDALLALSRLKLLVPAFLVGLLEQEYPPLEHQKLQEIPLLRSEEMSVLVLQLHHLPHLLVVVLHR